MQIRQHLFLIMAITFGWLLPDLAQSASTIYYCPDRKSDQQYSARPAPGCVPLVDAKQPNQGDDSLQPQREPTDFKIENLQSDVSAFLSRYHQLLECCKTDVSELQRIDEVGDEVGDLLKSTQAKLSNHSLASRGIMLREMILPVAKARADIKKLRATLNRIGAISNTRESGEALKNQGELLRLFVRWRNPSSEISAHQSCRQDQRLAPVSAAHQQQGRVSEKLQRPATPLERKA